MKKYAHITLGGSPDQIVFRGKILEMLKDRNPRLVGDVDWSHNVLTYEYEGDEMDKVRLPIGAMFYQMELDLDVRALYVHMMKHDQEIQSVVSADGDYIVDYYWNTDGLPVVVGFELLNPNKVSIIQDWIEDGIEAALAQLNDHPRHEFEDDHWKGVIINET